MVKGLVCLQVIVTGKVTRSRDCFVYKSLSQVKSHGQGIVLFTSHCHR